MRSRIAPSSRRFLRLTCVLHPTGTPAARRFSIARIAPAWLPLRARSASCVASTPSTETLTAVMPAALAFSASSRVKPRPPVTMVQSIPWARIARTISSQSGRRYASPPWMATSAVPISASWRTTSSASVVDSSSLRGRPARVPQKRHC